MKCSNCEKELGFNTDETTLVVNSHTQSFITNALATICSDCTTGVLTLKIVLSRKEKKDAFAFEGYLPVSSVK